jgi:hypothetical protein
MRATRLVSAAALVLLSFATTASAVTLDPRGLGQALVYPYYTVNNDQDTLVSIVNAGDTAKAVEMRFREGVNGRTVLQFVLFLSAHDVWTASLTSIADDDGAILRTTDTSCTDTAIPSDGVALRSADYDGNGVVPADGGSTSITRTREGFFEFIAVGDIVAGSPTEAAIVHVHDGGPDDGAPPACDTIPPNWNQTDLVVPTGTLYGSAALVDVGQGTFYPYNADAISGLTSTRLDPYRDGAYPMGASWRDANSEEAVSGVATAYVTDNRGRPLPLDYAFGEDAVSAVFMANAQLNEYIVAPSLGANTDWVVTFPTKSFYTDAIYGAVPLAPFESAFAGGVAPVTTGGAVYDREEGAIAFGSCDGFCPPVEAIASLSYAVNVLPVDNAVTQALVSHVFGSTLTPFAIPPFGDDGHIVLQLDGAGHQLPGGVDFDRQTLNLVGLPATGFMAYNVINTNAQPGLLANYSGVFRHRSTTVCSGNFAGCLPIISGDAP